jgi:hypothetical protein
MNSRKEVTCDRCKKPIPVECTKPISCTAEEAETEMLSMWESAIEERKQKDGWADDICPECHYLHAAEIAAERAAEVHEYEEER